MALVYTRQEIAGGLVPQQGRHQEVAHETIERLKDLQPELGTVAVHAMVFGSVALGELVTPRSDVDVFVRAIGAESRGASIVPAVVGETRPNRLLNVCVVPSATEALSAGHINTIDPFFARYMLDLHAKLHREGKADDFILGAPVDDLDMYVAGLDNYGGTEHLQASFEAYLAYKKRQLMLAQRVLPSVVQIALNLPANLTRKLPGYNPLATRAESIRGSGAALWDKGHGMWDWHAELVGIDTEYDQVLTDTLSKPSSANLDAYDTWVAAQGKKAILRAGSLAQACLQYVNLFYPGARESHLEAARHHARNRSDHFNS